MVGHSVRLYFQWLSLGLAGSAADRLDQLDRLVPDFLGLVPQKGIGGRLVGVTAEVEYVYPQSLSEGRLCA